jgi:hypothetical protein
MTKSARFLSSFLLLAGCGGSPAASDAAVTVDGASPDAAATDASTRDAAVATFELPPVHAICSAPSAAGSTHELATTNGVPAVALAAGPSDVGLAYVERPAPPSLLELRFQRLAIDGAPVGSSVLLFGLDMMYPGSVSIAADGSDYVACGITVASARCFRIGADDAAEEETVIDGASLVAVANGPGGLAAAWTESDGVHAGLLGAPGARIGSGGGAPSIAATDTGYVVGFASGAAATAMTLDATGAIVTSYPLGTTRSDGNVAVTFTSGTIGASFVGASGDALAVTVEASGTVSPAATIGAGADSYGQVSIARGADGFLASWSDFSGFIGVAPVALDGTATGTTYQLGASWDDNAHAIIGLPGGFLLAANTTPGGTPVVIASLACP